MMRRTAAACAVLAVLAWALFAGVPGLSGGLCGVGARPAHAQLVPTPGGAPQPVSADAVNAIAYRLYCPVCPNERLDSCQTQACAEWRAVIAQQLGEGRTEGEIRAYFVERYGERVLGTPEDPLLHAISVYVPFVLAGIALAAGVSTFLRWRAAARANADAHRPDGDPYRSDADAYRPDGDPYRAQIERDLRG
jgi:cytochrome c-type biogenesis protein CcmH